MRKERNPHRDSENTTNMKTYTKEVKATSKQTPNNEMTTTYAYAIRYPSNQEQTNQFQEMYTINRSSRKKCNMNRMLGRLIPSQNRV